MSTAFHFYCRDCCQGNGDDLERSSPDPVVEALVKLWATRRELIALEQTTEWDMASLVPLEFAGHPADAAEFILAHSPHAGAVEIRDEYGAAWDPVSGKKLR